MIFIRKILISKKSEYFMKKYKNFDKMINIYKKYKKLTNSETY